MKERVAIIGAGQAGAAVGHGLKRVGYDIVAVSSRSESSADALAKALDSKATPKADAIDRAELVFVTAPDDAIPSVVGEIAAHVGARHRVVHCSGVLPLDVLDPVRAQGAAVGVLHPVTPLVPPEAASTLSGKPMGVEASGDDAWLREVAEALGGLPVSLGGVDRTLYHAAACISANLVVAMSAVAEGVFEEAGVDQADARAVVASLLSSTAENVSRSGPAKALTGPVRRGDAEVLRKHRSALAEIDPELSETYRLVSRLILGLMPDGAARTASAGALAAGIALEGDVEGDGGRG